MEKVTRYKLTKRELEILLIGEIQTQTKNLYEKSKTYLLDTFQKEEIEKIANENGSFTKVEAKTSTIAELIENKKAEINKLKNEIALLSMQNPNDTYITKSKYIRKDSTEFTKEKAKEYIAKMLEDFTSKTLKQ